MLRPEVTLAEPPDVPLMPDADTEALPPAYFVDTEMSLSSPIELTWAFPPAPVAEVPPVAVTEA
jgi:hypothetical protein